MPNKQKHLVVIEAKGKLSSFQKYLPSDYEVVASYGHVMDLPQEKLGVNMSKNFAPEYKIMKGKNDVLKDILSKAKKAKSVILMMDKDREGAGIAWNIYQKLPKGISVQRAVTNVIAKKEINEAIQNAYPMSQEFHKAQAFEARRILDRLCGYKCSYLVQKASGGRSAGRVQSAVLRMLAEREREIQKFVPEKYWAIDLELKTKNGDKFTATIKSPKPLDIKKKEDADKIKQFVESNLLKVNKFSSKVASVKPDPPFDMFAAVGTASNILGWYPNKTTSTLQSLYTKGLISYHRTDSLDLQPQFISDAQSHVVNKFGSSYSNNGPRTFKSKMKNAQGAHEAIRPTNASLDSYVGGTSDEAKMYDLVWRRAVASQMALGKNDQNSVTLKSGDYIFSASGSKVKFDGFRKVWHFGSASSNYLPILNEGEEVEIEKINVNEKETQPPARYTVNSLQNKLKNDGIGRPSTIGTIFQTLQGREYISVNKSKSLVVSDLGLKVNDFLVGVGFCFVDLNFTSQMESKLDKVEDQSYSRDQLLRDFWDTLKKDIDNAKKAKAAMSKTAFKCPRCASNNLESYLCLRKNKSGEFFGCERYSDKEHKCTYIAVKDKNGQPVEKQASKKPKMIISDFKCPKCGAKMVQRQGKAGAFLGCLEYKKGCKGTRSLDGKAFQNKNPRGKNKKTPSNSNQPDNSEPVKYYCPTCESPMVSKKGKYGVFYGCTKYKEGCRGMRKKDGTEVKSKKS